MKVTQDRKQVPKVGKYVDDEEREFIESYQKSSAEFVSLLTPERKREFEDMASATMNGERAKISLRVPKRDLAELKSRAMQEGIPYQTLINSLIHLYISMK